MLCSKALDDRLGCALLIEVMRQIRDFVADKTNEYYFCFTDREETGLPGAKVAVVQGTLSLDPFNKSLYLFCGRRRDRIKGLLWEGDGFLLLYKRLDSGVFRWPRNEMEARLLSEQEIRWLLEGLELEQPKAIKESKPGILY